jgi:hypothetical protein
MYVIKNGTAYISRIGDGVYVVFTEKQKDARVWSTMTELLLDVHDLMRRRAARQHATGIGSGLSVVKLTKSDEFKEEEV